MKHLKTFENHGAESTNKTYYSEWYKEEIPQGKEAWSDRANSYIWKDQSTIVEYPETDVYPNDFPGLVWSEPNEEYLHIDDAELIDGSYHRKH